MRCRTKYCRNRSIVNLALDLPHRKLANEPGIIYFLIAYGLPLLLYSNLVAVCHQKQRDATEASTI